MPAGGWIKFPKPLRVGAGFPDEPFHFVVITPAQIKGDARIVLNCLNVLVLNCLNVFFVGFRMKDMRLHRWRIFWMRTAFSSGVTPLTFPDSISAMRRSVSAFHESTTDS